MKTAALLLALLGAGCINRSDQAKIHDLEFQVSRLEEELAAVKGRPPSAPAQSRYHGIGDALVEEVKANEKQRRVERLERTKALR